MSDERFDKAARAGDSAKGLVHYRNRLQKARLRRRGNARKIASRRSACGRSCCWRGCARAKESTALSKFDML